jgi:adenylyl-sulfate kinase
MESTHFFRGGVVVMKIQRKKLIIWFTGLSQSGKTTNARALRDTLRKMGHSAMHIDGDELRKKFGNDLGFTKEDRIKNVYRATTLAEEYIQENIVITSFISPYREQRREIRENFKNKGIAFIEVFCNCPIGVCEARDTKGLYAKARIGEIPNFTGISDVYEEPERPDITLLTNSALVGKNIESILSLLKERGIVK